jgi:ABC-type dipeptide/oligopeptide/nickel transport system permease subunit
VTDIDTDVTPVRGSTGATGPAPAGRSVAGADAAMTRVRDRTESLDPIKSDDTTPVEREFTVATRSQGALVLRRFLQHKLAVGSAVVFLAMVIVAIVGQQTYKYKYNQDPNTANDISVPPFTKGHLFGTDNNGIDLFAQILRGITTSVEVGLIVAVLCTGFGTIYGAVAGFFGGAVDNTLMRVVDLVLTLPALAVLLLLSVKFAGGGSAIAIALVLSALSWASISRVIRGLFLSLREKEFIEAARALGASNSRIIFRHLLPNAVGPIIVNGTIFVALAILTEAGLSFLGFGIKFPDVSLGLLISNGISAADTRPWLFYFPGATLVIIAICINFIGDGLRDALDPQQRVRQ